METREIKRCSKSYLISNENEKYFIFDFAGNLLQIIYAICDDDAIDKYLKGGAEGI